MDLEEKEHVLRKALIDWYATRKGLERALTTVNNVAKARKRLEEKSQKLEQAYESIVESVCNRDAS